LFAVRNKGQDEYGDSAQEFAGGHFRPDIRFPKAKQK